MYNYFQCSDKKSSESQDDPGARMNPLSRPLANQRGLRGDWIAAFGSPKEGSERMELLSDDRQNEEQLSCSDGKQV